MRSSRASGSLVETWVWLLLLAVEVAIAVPPRRRRLIPTAASACVVGLGGLQVEARVDQLTGAIQSQETKDCLGGGALAPVNLNAVGGDDSSDDESDHSSDDSSGDSHSD